MVVRFLSGEWILTRKRYTPNGGTVVALRAVWITVWVYLPALAFRATLAEGKSTAFSLRAGLADFVETLPWIAAIFGAAYIALYTRFSSQWNYLAGLYNQIVQSQIAMPDRVDDRLELLAAWKAGFIEDAEDLHLATKPLFIPAIINWAVNERIARHYAEHTIGGETRLLDLLLRLETIQHDIKQRHAARAARFAAQRARPPLPELIPKRSYAPFRM